MFGSKVKKYFILSINSLLVITLLIFINSVHAANFEVTKATLDFTGDENRYSVTGKIDFGLIDLAKSDLIFGVGSYNETIDAGSFVKNGSRYVYKAEPDTSGIKKMVLDLKAKTFSVEAFGADLSGTKNPVEISIMVGDSFFECVSANMKEKETEEGEVWSFQGKSKKCDDDSDSETDTVVQSTTTTTFQSSTTTTTSTTTSTLPVVKKEKVRNRICIFF